MHVRHLKIGTRMAAGLGAILLIAASLDDAFMHLVGADDVRSGVDVAVVPGVALATAPGSAVGTGDGLVGAVTHGDLLWLCRGVAQSAPRIRPSAPCEVDFTLRHSCGRVHCLYLIMLLIARVKTSYNRSIDID